jgi:FkbM family methyltransferase
MKDFAQSLREGIDRRPAALPDAPILVYGAGSRGKEVAEFLLGRGYELLGFADAAASGYERWRDLPIRTLTDWQRASLADAVTIVVAIHNHQVDIACLLDRLSKVAAGRIVNPVEFQAIYHDVFPESYWLAGPDVYEGHQESLVALLSLFADEVSRDLVRRVIEFRLTGNYAALPRPTPGEQYCPADRPRWPESLRIIDGGAFDGDTLRQFQRYGYRFEQIVAFEPDAENFARLSRYLAQLDCGICLPCGLARSCSQVRFAAGGTGASRIAAEGTQIIQCVSLDEALPGFRANLIKMDIEGAEPDALQGAAQMIAAHRPGLAISVYHHPAHLWQIPLMINSWRLDYQFYLRMHGHNSFDLVMYAFPRNP